jgi:hypothetical protein
VLVSVSETHSEEQVLHWGEVRETCRHPTSTVRAPEGGLLLDDSIWLCLQWWVGEGMGDIHHS